MTDTVCDNTRESALAEKGQEYKVKHSKYSHAQLAPAREALAMVHTIADDFAEEVATLCSITVTPDQWARFLDLQVSRVDATTGELLKGRSLALADRKRDASSACTGTIAGSLHGQARRRGSSRPSTPTNITRGSCGEQHVRNGTCSAR